MRCSTERVGREGAWAAGGDVAVLGEEEQGEGVHRSRLSGDSGLVCGRRLVLDI